MLVVSEVCFTLGHSWLFYTLECSGCLPYLLLLLQYFITSHLLWLHSCTLLQAISICTNTNYSTAWREKPVKPQSHSSVRGQGLMPAGDSSGRRVSTPLLKPLVHWPQRVGKSVCSTAVPDVS